MINFDIIYRFYYSKSKYIFFIKLPILALIAKFSCFNLLSNFSFVNLLNSGVGSWLGIFFNFFYYCVVVSFFN